LRFGRFLWWFFTKEAVREKAFAAVQEAGSEAQKSECLWQRNFCFQPGFWGMLHLLGANKKAEILRLPTFFQL